LRMQDDWKWAPHCRDSDGSDSALDVLVCVCSSVVC
jgi:hypothetical protein